ncbi:MAG: hypothetical protein IK024_10815 [Treponema sp.]|nr:hypothetical protein [Treponema sp.]
MKKELFDKIKKEYGKYASWAVFAEETDKPKSNMGDISILEPDNNPELLKILKTNVIMVGLNFSHEVGDQNSFVFKNFHDSSRYAQDYKIRYAFRNTEYYGAYMTDIIKNYPQKDSNKVAKVLTPDKISENIEIFKNELKCIETKNPTILCFGKQVYDILSKNLRKEYYKELIQITHYSYRIGKEKYKEVVLDEINHSKCTS